MSDLVWHTELTDGLIADIDALLMRVRDADGVSPISEHAYLHLLAGGGHGERHGVVTGDGRVIGYAHVSSDAPPTAELLVDPAERGKGIGTRLLAGVLATGGDGVRVWAHGQLPGATALAEACGMRAVRQLCRYTRSLADLPEPVWPDGVRVRSFEPADAPAWLELNAGAFADLPDQGSWTMADLQRRLQANWFSADGFLLAFDHEGLAGCHWTKVHGGEGHDHGRIGEVYVLAVAPRARGTGLARALTAAGLWHLRDQGLESVMLYVDASNAAAVALYTRLGFTRSLCDVQFASPTAATGAGMSGRLGS